MNHRASSPAQAARAARSRGGGARVKVRRALATLAAVTSLAVVGVAPASADPNGFTWDLVCDSLGTVKQVTFSNGDASPGLAIDNNRVVLAYAWEVVVHATPNEGDPFTRVFSYSRGVPQNGRLDSCTIHYVVTNAVGTGVFDGWALISYTP